jgi:plasmid replication initiation protein
MQKVSVPVLVNLKKVTTKQVTNSFNNAVIAVQHNNLVQAKYSMSLQQKRIMIWLVSQIKPNDEDFKEHALNVKELKNICALSGESAYKELKNITFSLVEKGIRILDITNPKDEIEIQVSWLSSAKYKNGMVRLTFNPELKPYLLQLKDKFTAINVVDLMQFKSIHAIRIYEILKQYEKIRERTLSIEEIKEYCGVKDKLTQYSDFERKILLIAQREINEKSDIKFDFERKKQGRKIVAIRFIISKNKAYELRNNPTLFLEKIRDEKRINITDTLEEFGLSKRTISKILKYNSEEDIQNAIKAVDIQLLRNPVRNAKAMLVKAIEQKWHPERYKTITDR